MADETDTAKRMTPTKRVSLLRGFTPAERIAGRFLRSPDGHPTDPPAADPAPVDSDPAAPDPADADDGTILGGDPQDPPADPDPADPAPESPPEKYELTAPEGMTLDEETLAEADPIFRELGLTNEKAQTLIPVAAKFAERIAEQTRQQQDQVIVNEVVAQRKAWAAEARADAEIGGGNWDQTQELAAKALDALGYPKGSTFRSFLTDSGLGNHPEMIRAMRKIGELVGEDNDFVRADAAVQVKPSREAVLYPNDVPANQRGAG